MNKVKQVIVIRKDLNMRKGKIAAQCCHGSLCAILDQMNKTIIHGGLHEWSLLMSPDIPLYKWLNGSFTKVVLYVNSEEGIFDLEKKCKSLDIPCVVITDSGFTEFHGVPTVTCITIGPDWSEKIDEITGDLPLL